jgi:hypothetical protein
MERQKYLLSFAKLIALADYLEFPQKFYATLQK